MARCIRSRTGWLLAVTIAVGLWWPLHAADGLPQRLTDAQFWRLIADVSELNGTFRSDNLLSNEVGMQDVIPELTRVTKSGRVYIGVGPEQNYTYIAAVRPAMAFIVDVRRGNLDLQLMYKALFELSADRAEFVSRLFSRPRPDGLGEASSASAIFAAFMPVPASEALYKSNLQAVLNRLTRTHALGLLAEDVSGIGEVYRAFFEFGPAIQYSSTGRSGGRNQPTYADLMTATDAGGQARSYLATEDRYAFVKDLETRNMLVPVVGNFGGPRAIRRVGTYLKGHGATVSAFYLSNVEQYLRMDGLWVAFCANAAALPLDESSLFIRSVRGGQSGQPFGFGLTSELGSMLAETRDCAPSGR
ncbi:MAG TPA: hypothetical protein VG222_05835 [Vicinamibacterales bacterium]|nr:hypothetical protein [Vicinamibacterales bacterium]